MQSTWMVWTTLVNDHLGVIPVKFTEEKLFKEIVDGRTHARTMDDGQWAITKAHIEHFVLRWAKNASNYNTCVNRGDNFVIKFFVDSALRW